MEWMFGALLRRHRLAAGMTQEELAERAGLSVNAIGALERGINRTPQHDTLDLLVGALALPVADGVALRDSARRRSAERLPNIMRMGDATELRLPLTSFHGREAELATLRSLLLAPRSVRLLTLTGPPGVGKTRLALEAAASLPFDEGAVRFVSLAPIHDPALTLPTIFQALGLASAPGQRLAPALALALRGQPLLLILDNCEHVAAAATDLSELLSACLTLRLFVTSRVRLGISGEREMAILPLTLPPDLTMADGRLERLATNAVVRIFVERAQAIRSDFALTAGNAADVARICRRLDGLPLAIELAAPRVKILPPHALLARLDNRLALLTDGPRDLPERQRTLRAAIAWSYDLLTPPEQSLFRALGVFVGGATLTAIEAVVATEAGRYDTLDCLSALVDHSLVGQQEGADGQRRFSMLETVLEFGREQLGRDREETGARVRHAAYYLELAEAAERGLQGSETASWLDRTEEELENFRAAARWHLEHGAYEQALRLVGALWFSFVPRGRILEGQGLITPVLAATTGQQVASRAKALFGAGYFLVTFDDHAAGRPLLAESLAIAEALGDSALSGYAHLGLGLSAKSDEDWSRVDDHFRQAVACLEASDDWWGLAWAYEFAAKPSFDGRVPPFNLAYIERAQQLFQAHGNAHGLVEIYRDLAVHAAANDDMPTARMLLEKSIAISRTLGARLNVAWSLEWLAGVTLALGALEAARRYGREAILNHRDLGNQFGVVKILGILATQAYRAGKVERAAMLAGAAAAHETPLGASRRRALASPSLRPEAWQPGAQAAIGPAAWNAAYAAGRAMRLGAAIALAVEDTPVDSVASSPTTR